MKREKVGRTYSKSYFDDICRVQLWIAIAAERILVFSEADAPIIFAI